MSDFNDNVIDNIENKIHVINENETTIKVFKTIEEVGREKWICFETQVKHHQNVYLSKQEEKRL